MSIPFILLILLVLWLFGASLLKVSFWIIVVVAIGLLVSSALVYFKRER